MQPVQPQERQMSDRNLKKYMPILSFCLSFACTEGYLCKKGDHYGYVEKS